MKKIMILGAGIYQVPLIKKAKDMGLYTIVVSYNGNYPGFKYADKVYHEDTTNFEAILNIAKEEEIDGVCTTGTDVAVPTIGKLVDELGLKGLSYSSALKAGNKKEMKDAFIKYGVRTSKYLEIKNIDDGIEAFNKLTKPVIFKAVDSSGSRGITRVDNLEQIDKAFKSSMSVTKKDYCIVEEFIEGEEFGAQAFVYDKKIQFIMPHGDYVFQGDTGVPIGHYVPYELDISVSEDLYFQLQKSVEALDFDYCAINADFIMKNNKIYVLEIGARAGATCLPEMVNVSYGVEYYKEILKVAIGDCPDFLDYTGNTPCAVYLLFVDKTGIIDNISYEKSKVNDLIEISFDYKVGDNVRNFRVGPDRVGHIITTGKTIKDGLDLMFNEMKKIEIKVK